MRNIVGRDGQEVDLVRELVRGLNRRDIRVDKDGFDVGLPESLDSLRAWLLDHAKGVDIPE